MADLTDAQVRYIRSNSGDDVAGEYEVEEDDLQVIYDDTTQGNSDLNRTVYFVILRRLGLAASGVGQTHPQTGVTHSKNQKFEQLERLLKLWGIITGIGAGVSVGISSTFTYRADSLQTSEPDYSADTTTISDDV